jgi:hypothetical protein
VSEKEELAALLKKERWKRFSYRDEDGYLDGGMAEQSNNRVAEALLNAGYRRFKPVESVEELDALPGWSVILADGFVYVYSSTGEVRWESLMRTVGYSSASLFKHHRSIAVLHNPKETL